MAIALASVGFDVTVVDGASEKDRIKQNREEPMLYLEPQRICSLILGYGMKKN